MWPTFYIPDRIRQRVVEHFFLTTQLYPLLVVDEMTANNVDVYDYNSTSFNDAMTESSTIQSGTLDTILKRHDQPQEDQYTSSTTMQSGELISVLVSYIHPPEDFYTSSTTMLSGTLERILIRYTNWPTTAGDEESITCSPTAVLSGSLT